jgi:hypothetical protein
VSHHGEGRPHSLWSNMSSGYISCQFSLLCGLPNMIIFQFLLMATMSDFESNIAPADFVGSWRQKRDRNPVTSQSSLLNFPNSSNTENRLLDQDNWPHYGDETPNVMNTRDDIQARENKDTTEPRFSRGCLQNWPQYVSKVLFNTIFEE